MNWSKAVIAGIAAGAAITVVNYIAHALIMANTYANYPVIAKPTPSLYFLLVAILVGIAGAILFAKTRKCWSNGVAGGAAFGFWLGLVSFFGTFYSSLVIVGFPYFLDWCWGAINLIGAVIGGCVLGAIYKQP